MALIKYDLLEALKELLEVSQALTNGNPPSGRDRERYARAVEWSIRELPDRDFLDSDHHVKQPHPTTSQPDAGDTATIGLRFVVEQKRA